MLEKASSAQEYDFFDQNTIRYRQMSCTKRSVKTCRRLRGCRCFKGCSTSVVDRLLRDRCIALGLHLQEIIHAPSVELSSHQEYVLQQWNCHTVHCNEASNSPAVQVQQASGGVAGLNRGLTDRNDSWLYWR